MTKIELAYLAGFFDGEGYVGILKRNRNPKWNPEYWLQVSIGQKDAEILEYLMKEFGGHFHTVKRDGSFMWLASHGTAYNLLKYIEPYVRYKKPQVQLALEFQEQMIEANRSRQKNKLIPSEEIEKREWYHQELKRLKTMFAGSTTKRTDPKGM